MIKALNFAYNAYSAGSVYLSKNFWANESQNKGPFGELLCKCISEVLAHI
jgi:hypothetical protein